LSLADSGEPIRDLKVVGGSVFVGRRSIDGLIVEDVQYLKLETDEDRKLQGLERNRPHNTPEIQERMHESITLQRRLADNSGKRPTILGLSGNVERISISPSSILVALELGLLVKTVETWSECEFRGLNPLDLSFRDIAKLDGTEHLSFWVSAQASVARKTFRNQLDKTEEHELGRLRERRMKLLSIAVSRRQDGHTLSILREAEKDARTATSPKRSRERFLLRVSQALTGHGERILRPLWFWFVFLVVLVFLHVGSARFFSTALWTSRPYTERFLYVLRFGFPGSSFVDVKPVGGCSYDFVKRF
jgi:hypothetical protein